MYKPLICPPEGVGKGSSSGRQTRPPMTLGVDRGSVQRITRLKAPEVAGFESCA